MVLVHEDVRNEKISPAPLLDDRFIEVDWEGNILWQWRPHEHFDELGFGDREVDIRGVDTKLEDGALCVPTALQDPTNHSQEKGKP